MSAIPPDEREASAGPTPWYADAFDDLYLRLYAHRDLGEVEALRETLRSRLGLHPPVFDLCCGGGRFLSVAGPQSYGLDLSLPLLAAARRVAPAAPLVRGDMRALPWRDSTFGTLVMLFTCFGYFDTPAEDEAVIREVARVTRPGGVYVLDFLNAERVRRTLVPEGERVIDRQVVRERRWIDEQGPFVRKRIEIGAPANRIYEERVRLYRHDQLQALLERNGFAVSGIWGEYDGRPFVAAESSRAIILGTRRSFVEARSS
ncbi:MAG: class I SAM-dependent methyltransferase [Candidatus Eisenbacteria bacterium]|nr:class I SAM-dependent methyltransferase [Candidatus Eisenbacteria bacterium]MCC7141774.1 class I SAM-dependent methyltransferase [Candidatus Eisenbacteria bacterium]